MSLKGGASNTYLTLAAPLEEGHAYTQLVRLDEALAHLDRMISSRWTSRARASRRSRGARPNETHRPTLLTEFNPRCLREVGGVAPLDYAEQLLSSIPVRAITVFGDGLSIPGCIVADGVLGFGETPS